MVASRTGIKPLGFEEPIVLLTAVHFHFTGFAVPILAARLTDEVRWARFGALGVIGVLPFIAAGITISKRLEQVSAIALAASVATLALAMLAALPKFPRASRPWLVFSATAGLFGMALASAWVAGRVDLLTMARYHGIANALGFTICGLIAVRLHATQETPTLSYADVGATREGRVPAGFFPLSAEVRLGEGDACFARAREALQTWTHFQLGWVTAFSAEIATGKTATIRIFGLPVRCWIVWVRDEARRFEFAYGTMPGHVESGEERFSVIQRGDGSVWYEVASFSRIADPALRFATPIARRFQQRFLRESCAAMARAISGHR